MTEKKAVETDAEGDLVALNFAARWLLTRMEGTPIAERAVESLADFGKSDRVGLFLIDAEGGLCCIAGCVDGIPRKDDFPLALSDEIHEALIQGKNTGTFPLAARDGIPTPDPAGSADRTCLAAPLIAANNQVIGVATFDYPAGFCLPPLATQSLTLLLTLTAIALENARLFQNVAYDGLTALYVRRYFDHRLAEEETRIRRYGGGMAVLLLDIDHFKCVNDTYGHPQGDRVLREVARVIRASVRQEVDAPCRYGGEEFVVVMPDTDPAGALVVAERIRQDVASLAFTAPEGTFQVTISGGIAAMDAVHRIPRTELLERVDAALYRAKHGGRNRIRVWGD
jgi:diguanylate cyclase (GGDEF)-like protein